jgi:hypothetical protein
MHFSPALSMSSSSIQPILPLRRHSPMTWTSARLPDEESLFR